MKKFNVLSNLFCATVLALACAFMVPAPVSADMVSNAGLIPAGYGYTHGRIPVIEATGRPEIHDAAIMRYDRNSRIKDTNNGEGINPNYQQSDNGVRNKDF